MKRIVPVSALLSLSLLCGCSTASVPDGQEQDIGDPTAGTVEAATSEDGSPEASASQKNALRSAQNYIRSSGFSHDGLVEQLEYEQYSNADAVWAADHCGADWNAEALEKAKSYVSMSGFSRDGLVDQLVFDKFTDEQAAYGADNCGADWNAEAVEKAKSYLHMSGFSHDSLVQQLTFEKFTPEQAEYGVSQNGL